MRFTKLIAIVAIISMAAQANAQDGGTLRRAANEPTVVLIPAQNVNVNPAAQAQTQPATVVEAAPVSESKAEMLRKARQNQEVQTEQKIVEKLEESRLKEEQQRAERLFGDKLDTSAQQPVQQPAAQPVAPAPAPAPVPVQPQQVTIEKIEIVQPPVEKVEEKPVVEPVAETKASFEEEAPASAQKFYVGGVLAAPSYGAANLKTNYGLGFTVGTLLKNQWAVEGMFLFSNHYVDTFWDYNLYREMSQYDFQAVAKYYILPGDLKPYVGGGAAYVYRKYDNRIKNTQAWMYNSTTDSEDTHSVVLSVVAGADFAVSENFLIGAGIDYNKPIMNKNTPNFASYGLPDNTKPVEEFDYYTFKVNARMSF